MSAWSDLIAGYCNYNDVTDQLKVASLAQWIQESGRGTSDLAQKHFNFGGLKYRGRMKGFAKPVDYTGSDGEETTYCKFDSVDEFIKGYWHFIESGPYGDWQKFKSDSGAYIDYLAKAGYSADPKYAVAVKSLLRESSSLLNVSASLGDASTGASAVQVKRPPWTELTAKFLNRRGGPVLGIVLHDTAGSGTHNDTKYLANPQDGRKVSVDFTVERDGSIWKLNPDLRAYFCNHAGRATSWNGFKNAQVNAVTVGIEIVQKDNLSLQPTYPDEQVRSVGKLCAWLSATFGIKNSAITTHRQIITDGSRSDPRKFPFDDFWAAYWEAFGTKELFVASQEGTVQEDDLSDELDLDVA